MFNLSLILLSLLTPLVIAINVDFGKAVTASVVDTSAKLTGGKFIAGFVDTCGATLNCERSRRKTK
jgi:hypothetical protein